MFLGLRFAMMAGFTNLVCMYGTRAICAMLSQVVFAFGCLALCDGGRKVIRLLAKARIRLTSDRRQDVE